MRGFAGAPGTPTGLALRVAQCVFAAGSVAFMATTPRFTTITAFCYLVASMGLQAIWSLGLALLDAYAVVKKKDIRYPILVSLCVVGDWLTATLSLSAASASAGITVLFFLNLQYCSNTPGCLKYQLSVVLAFLSWITVYTSSLIMLWLLAAG
ncbi:hypothetical protein Ancab_013132 [Ancistrocladus abbreviatus]